MCNVCNYTKNFYSQTYHEQLSLVACLIIILMCVCVCVKNVCCLVYVHAEISLHGFLLRSYDNIVQHFIKIYYFIMRLFALTAAAMTMFVHSIIIILSLPSPCSSYFISHHSYHSWSEQMDWCISFKNNIKCISSINSLCAKDYREQSKKYELYFFFIEKIILQLYEYTNIICLTIVVVSLFNYALMNRDETNSMYLWYNTVFPNFVV